MRKDLKSMATTMVKIRNPITKKDPDVKAAKKEIRKNGSFTQVVDDFGKKHGYESDKARELYNSRLVVRENAKGTKKNAKSRLKSFRGKESRKGFKSDEFTTSVSNLRGEEFTAKDGNKARKDEIKRIKQESKDIRRSSRLNAKANRIKSRI
jgi:hypothetical protein|tara:strand:- start:121 stop:576 length:456 start_codon:yes stop_codon:yes gene_type:complete